MTKSNRIDYLDIAKGIGILLVIIGHIPYVSEPVRQYIVTFHMPLFLIISGMLICHTWKEQEKITSFIKRKVRNLLLPYAFFSVAYIVIELCRILIKGSNEWGQLFRQIFQSLCLQGVSVLWFFPALFIAEVLFIIIRKTCNHLLTLLSLPILMLVSFRLTAKVHVFFFAHTDDLGLCLLFDVVSMLLRGIFCIGLVGAGYYLGLVLEGRKVPVPVDVALSVGALTVVFFVTDANGLVDLRYMFLGKLGMFLLGGILGSVGVLLLCRILARFPVGPIYNTARYFGINSMLIMVTHLDFHVLNVSIKIAALITASLQNNVVFCVLTVVLVCIFEILIIEFVKRLLPYIAKRVRKIS